MLPNQLKTYRNLVTLTDGVQVLLRPMTAEDCERLTALFTSADEVDTRYLRHNVRDADVIRGWCDSLDYQRVLPVMALFKDRAVGQATLHFREGPERHIGEVRVFLAKDFRRRGLGTRMINTIIDLARKHNLYALVAKIVTDQAKVVRAFLDMGFYQLGVLDDYYMLASGETRDVSLLVYRLREQSDEF